MSGLIGLIFNNGLAHIDAFIFFHSNRTVVELQSVTQSIKLNKTEWSDAAGDKPTMVLQWHITMRFIRQC